MRAHRPCTAGIPHVPAPEAVGPGDMALNSRTEGVLWPPQGYRLPAKAVCVGLALLALVGVGMLYIFDPREPGNYPVCPFLGITGHHCPGCGTLRALHQLLHRNPITALGYNPLTVLSLPILAYTFAVGALRAFQAPAPAPIFIRPSLIWGLFLGIVAFWALRNVPVEPLSILAP